MSGVFNIAAGTSFVDALAAGALDRRGSEPDRLAEALILVPTRRAARHLGEAFLRQSEGRALVLPPIRPIGDVDEDELAVAAAGEGAADLDIAPAIDPMRRRLLLARQIRSGVGLGAVGDEQAIGLAEALAAFIDEVDTAEADFAGLDTLVEAELSEHWQTTLRFLKSVRAAWRDRLAAEGRLDPAERRRFLLDRLADEWRREPPAGPVIAAGSTGSIPATSRLLARVARLPEGAVVLPGLDEDMDDDAWEKIGPGHPQHGLKTLLEGLGVGRAEVRPWPVDRRAVFPRGNPARRRLLSDALRPPEAGPAARPPDDGAVEGLEFAACANPREEARAAALRMRVELEEKGRTVALVTRDRSLARRVASELTRWGIEADDSAGVPLATTPAGVFFRLVARAPASGCAPVPLLALLKHPFLRLGREAGAVRGLVRALERAALRGPRPAPGLDGLRRAIPDRPERTSLLAFLDELEDAVGDFAGLLAGPRAPLDKLAAAHGRAVERLSEPEAGSRESIWRNDDGEALHAFLTDLLAHADVLGFVETSSYPASIDSLLSGRTVRPGFGRHPRAFIWGPLEARMQHADCTILAGLAEGSWPPEPPSDPWLSRPMRARLGLPTPERRIGLAAHDFVQAACADRVLLLHSERSGGAPTVPARWLVRLRAALDAHGPSRPGAAGASPWRLWPSALDRPPAVEPAPAPRPCPPLEARPKELSVTRIETWLRDPYAVYARHILGLRPLDDLDEEADAAARGIFVHEALERFVAEFPEKLPPDALERLLEHGRAALGATIERPSVAAFWWPRFERIAAWFVEEETRRRETTVRVAAERTGRMEIPDGRGGAFALTAKADRLEVLPGGALRIVDYKTGAAPTGKSVASGSAPQLPLEAALAQAGAFEDVDAASVAGLEYWELSGGRPAGKTRQATGEDPSGVARAARDGLGRLVAAFADPETAYLDHPAGAPAGRFDDYLDVARTDEWRLGWPTVLDDMLRDAEPERETPVLRRSNVRQQAMSDPSRTVWVSASAGAGKTKVLTDRVLRLLLEGCEPSRILCLTFTRAAAAEMANRVRRELANWSTMDDRGLDADLTALTGSRPDRETFERSRRLFAATLEAPGGLRIATIHSFCQSLLGRFPLEAGVAPYFRPIEDRARAELLRAARDEAIASVAAGRAPHLRDALDRLALEAGERRAGDILDEICDRAADFDRMMERYGSLDRALAALAAGLRTDPARSVEDLMADACRDSALDGPGLRAAAEALSDGTATDRKTAETVLAFLDASEAERPSLLDAHASCFLLKADRTPRLKPVGTKKTREDNPDAVKALDRETERLAALYARVKAAATFERTRAILVLGSEILGTFRRMKRDRAVLDYDDLIARARDLLTLPGVAPWVLYKLDGGLDHVLVDEAQDTSPAQWEVVLALTGEFFAGAGAREEPRTLFVVGDGKQSIFSFQGADVEALRKVRDRLREDVVPAGEWREGSLDLSYRSVPAVLEAVDAVFAAPEAASGVAFEDEPIRHESFRKDDGGLAEVWPLLKDDEDDEDDDPAGKKPDDPWTACLDEARPRDRNARLAAAIAKRIAAMTGDDGGPGEILASRGDAIRPGDILILVRRRGELVSALVRALRREGVAVAGVDRMDLIGEIAVRDLLALGRVCLLPEDDLSLAAVLKGPFVGFDDDMLFDLAWRRARRNGKIRETLWAALRRRKGDSDAFARAAAWIASLLCVADRLAPFEFFDRVLSAPSARAEGFDGRKALLARLGLEAQDPLDEFLNLALAFERDDIPSLQGFVRWLSSGAAEVKREAETAGDAVRIMTVHGAKGLQAPTVFLADVAGRGPAGPAILWDGRVDLPLWVGAVGERAPWGEALDDRRRRRAAEEERRLLYVALTRARDRLYVCAAARNDAADAGSWRDAVAAAMAALPGVESATDGVWDDWGGEALRLSSPQRRAVAAARAGPGTRVPVEGPPPGILLPPPPERPADRPISPSRLAGTEAAPRSPLAGGDDGAALRRGRLAHRLLELLPDLEPGAREKAARTLVARYGPAPGGDDDALIARVLAILDDPAFAPVFAPGGRSEASIAGVVGETVVAGRVDRLTVTEDRIGVIDFKTGLNTPARVDDTPTVYLKQLAAYREVLRKIYPERTVSCGLLWCDIPELVEIPPGLLDTHRPEGLGPRAA